MWIPRGTHAQKLDAGEVENPVYLQLLIYGKMTGVDWTDLGEITGVWLGYFRKDNIKVKIPLKCH